jgi:CubicO group peptidase (beta-lactamase class C family)
MTTLVAHLDDIQRRLDALARRHQVPGATLAVSRGDELIDFATGVISARTGVAATPDTVFQIGSNTKLMTATLIMQLADAGRADLDVPVRQYVPTLELAEPGAADAITLRHLLTHTSGIEGDYFAEFGRGDDAVGRYVDSLKTIGTIHRPGQLWSYCNSGFVLAGYVVEQLTGQPFHQVLRERICEPLGLGSVTVLAEEMIAPRCAVGHLPGPGGVPVVPPVVLMGTASAPAGSRTVSTAADLAAFARVHLSGGSGPDGARLLSAAGTRAMQDQQASRPSTNDAPAAQGLGWMLAQWGGQRVIGHGGGTIGQTSFLQALPDSDLVVVLLTNWAGGDALWEDLGRWLFETLAGVSMPAVPRPPDPAPDLRLADYAGTYERLGVRYEVTVDGGELVMATEFHGELAETFGAAGSTERLQPVTSEAFRVPDASGGTLVRFLEFRDGRPDYLFAGRAARRRDEGRAAAPPAVSD